MLKYCLLIAASAFIIIHNASAQEIPQTSTKTNQLTDSVKEVYHVLKTNKNIKHGLYQAFYGQEIQVATGMYEQGKKVGVWRFYDFRGKPMQTYDYSNSTIVFDAPEDTTSNIRYLLDKNLTLHDKANKPIKTGGRYFGFLTYLRLFKLPKIYYGHPEVLLNEVQTRVELLISPGGRLAGYNVIINNGEKDNVIAMNTVLNDEEDRIFKPALLNGEPVACRIVIRVYITEHGHLDFY